MIKKMKLVLPICMVLAFGRDQLMALTIGMYGNTNFGRNYFSGTLDKYSGLKSIDEKFSVNTIGGGLILEFVSVEDHTIDFRYRFKAGAEAAFAQNNILRNMYRISFSNIFYFGIFNYDMLNMMIGPQIGACYHYGHTNILFPNYILYSGYLPYPNLARAHLRFEAGGINLGLSLNLDFNIDKYFTIFCQINCEQNFYLSSRNVTGKQVVLVPPPPPAQVPPIASLGISSKKVVTDIGTEGSLCFGAMYKIRISQFE
jgi:hypothetical protein